MLQRTPLAATPSASAALDPNGVEQRKDRFMLVKNIAVGDSAGNDNQDERQSIKSPPSEIYSTMSVMNSRSKEVSQNWMTGNYHQQSNGGATGATEDMDLVGKNVEQKIIRLADRTGLGAFNTTTLGRTDCTVGNCPEARFQGGRVQTCGSNQVQQSSNRRAY